MPPYHRRRLAMVAAPLVTALAVGLGVAGFGRLDSPSAATGNLGAATGNVGAATGNVGAAAGVSTTPSAPDSSTRTLGTSRSTERVPLVNTRVPKAKGKLWTTSDLDLRVEPRAKSGVAGLLKTTKHVSVTGRHQGAYAEVIVNNVARWVTADYLSKEKAVPAKAGQPGSTGLVDRSCPGTEGTESGLTDDAVRVYRAVCNNFPEITTYGGFDGHGEHASGRAIDIMTSDSGVGDRIAAFLETNAGALNLYDVIWQQQIWTPERSGEGWRGMEDRGSTTANHGDHVHVSVN